MATARLALFRRLLPLYSGAPVRVRARLLLRIVICPLDEVASAVPSRGPVLDLGCGCGFVTALINARGGEQVVGADPDSHSLSEAAHAVPGGRFVRASVLSLPFRGLATIIVSDVLYLLSAREQARALVECKDALVPGGTLVLKTTDVTPRWKYWWNVVQETLVVSVLRLTKGAGRFCFPGRRGFTELLESSGFDVEECIDLERGYLHPHVVVVARKAA